MVARVQVTQMPTVPDIQPSAIHAKQKPSFEMGGPPYKIMQHLGRIQRAGPPAFRRSLWFIPLTWVSLRPQLDGSSRSGNSADAPSCRSSLLASNAVAGTAFVR